MKICKFQKENKQKKEENLMMAHPIKNQCYHKKARTKEQKEDVYQHPEAEIILRSPVVWTSDSKKHLMMVPFKVSKKMNFRSS
jgi:hypothetical protein